jgi:TonB family protein
MRWRFLFFLALLATTIPTIRLHAQSNAIEQNLRDQYKGKTLILRNFPTGNHLAYDSRGNLTSNSISGDWTVAAAVQLSEVRVSKHRLVIEANRLYLGWMKDVGLSSIPESKDERKNSSRTVQIQAALSSESIDAAESLVSKIFLTPQDDFAALVPDYWRPCLLSGLAQVEPQTSGSCRVSPEFLRIPGVMLHSEKTASPQDLLNDPAKLSIPGVERSAKGIKPPKVTFQTEPEFAEEAQRAKFQGTMTLGVVIDEKGGVQKVWILSPLGSGLDKRAVDTVQTWRFNPAEKDGKPVPFVVAIEVDFRLY